MTTGVQLSDYSFGSVRVDGVTYDHDLIIDRGTIRKRHKGASRKFRGEGRINHTVPFDAALPFERRRHNIDPEMCLATLPVAGMPLMQM